MTSLRLRVYLDGTAIGSLEHSATGRLSFEYDDDYRQGRSATPLSLSMPLVRSLHPHRVVHAFLWGLLPDSRDTLIRLGREFGVSAANPMALLAHVGRDAAGAVQILPEDEPASDARSRTERVRPLAADEFRAMMLSLSADAPAWDAGADTGRWSLAGAQTKAALFRFPDGSWGVPEDATPTTHILKPAVAALPEHGLNEHLTMLAARALGLSTADTEILTEGVAAPVFVTRRYDRLKAGGGWHRVHQEDFCQALSVVPEKKYQSDGGPGVTEMAHLLGSLRSGDESAASSLRLFEALVFNVAIAGTDAHAKNYSMLLVGPRVALAPLYDVATAAPYPHAQPLRSAMTIGGEWRFDRIGRSQLQLAARKLGVDQATADTSIDRIRSGAARAYADVAREMPAALTAGATRIANAVYAMNAERGYAVE